MPYFFLDLYLSIPEYFQLEAGDLKSTGTTAGVSPIVIGDLFLVETCQIMILQEVRV